MDVAAIILSDRWRIACTILQVVPVPGVGAVIAGWRNPHTRLRGHGIAQLVLVLAGSYPWIVPGAVGLAWAVWDAVVIFRQSVPTGARSKPVRVAP